MTSNSSAIEQRLRAQVAACTLILNDLELLGYSGHVSARLPEGDRLLVQPFELSRSEVQPSDLLIADMDGRLISGSMKLPSEIFIHTEILKARPDVNAVAHFHHDRTTVFTLVEGAELLPIKNHAIRWASGIPVHDDPSHVNTQARGKALANTLGPHHATLIRAHGQVVTAEDLPSLLIDCVHFVENAEAMYDAAMLGKVRPLTASEIAIFEDDLKRDRHVKKLWKYYAGRARAKNLFPADWDI